MKRLLWLDLFRGVAVVMMVIFHLLWDLNQYHILSVNIFSYEMLLFRSMVLGMFLFAVGVSLQLSYTDFNPRKLLKRLGYLLLMALLISLGSYLIYPHNWIYFGVIHMIALSTLLGVVFVGHKRVAWAVALVVFVVGWGSDFNLFFIKTWVSENLLTLPEVSFDLVPMVPWFGFVLLGIAFNIRTIKYPQNRWTVGLQFVGKHTMIIYLAHQPIMLGILFILL